VPAAAVTKALGGEATLAAYDNGEKSEAFPGGDVPHEYGCRFSPSDTGSLPAAVEARAWVFAPPITTDAAQAMATASVTKTCTALPGAPAYGTPSAGVLCPGDGVQTVSFRGLFGDAWLACSLTLPTTVPQDELVQRAGRWCVAVAQAASVPLT
jgi:hypothetical protein